MLCGDSYKDGMKQNVCGELMEQAFRLGKRGGGVGEGRGVGRDWKIAKG